MSKKKEKCIKHVQVSSGIAISYCGEVLQDEAYPTIEDALNDRRMKEANPLHKSSKPCRHCVAAIRREIFALTQEQSKRGF